MKRSSSGSGTWSSTRGSTPGTSCWSAQSVTRSSLRARPCCTTSWSTQERSPSAVRCVGIGELSLSLWYHLIHLSIISSDSHNRQTYGLMLRKDTTTMLRETNRTSVSIAESLTPPLSRSISICLRTIPSRSRRRGSSLPRTNRKNWPRGWRHRRLRTSAG